MSEVPALEFAIDRPAGSLVREGQIEISGWCFHRLGTVSHLQLLVDGNPHDARFSRPRPDVALVYPDAIGAERSGFIAVLNLQPGVYRIDLRARVGGLGTVETTVIAVMRVSATEVSQAGFLRFLAGKARLRLREGRGVPRWGEVLHLLRGARDDHRTLKVASAPEVLAAPQTDPYERWLSLNEWTPTATRHLRDRLASRRSLPLISIVTPVFRPDPEHFAETIRSVKGQVHDVWEWCIADDASADAALTRTLETLVEQDSRIRLVTRPDNGHISAASNSAADMATGEYLAFLDHDDTLSPDAIGEVALYLEEHPDVDLLYSDDDKIGRNGRRHGPQFKADWSPESLLSQMYFCHLLVARRRMFDEVGGFRAGFEGSQDHDLALRITERTQRVAHLPLVLYHWREADGSTAVSGNEKPYSFEAGVKAVNEAFARRGIQASAYRPDWAVVAGASLIAHRFPDDGPLVDVLIATRNGSGQLERCLSSLPATTYRNYQVVLLDDESDDPSTLALLSRFRGLVIRGPGPRLGFNYAKLHNDAARRLSGDYLVFLNDDTEVREPRWLSQLVGFGTFPGVGVVGARLLYPNGTVQHAGVLKGFNQGDLAAAFRGIGQDDAGYLAAAKVCRNYGAVTAACMLTPRKLFLGMGGFDEDSFPVSFNDIDYCYRIVDAGYRCVYAPGAELVHHEGASRGSSSSSEEIAAFRSRYRWRPEPYYNPNLSTTNERFEVLPRRLARSTHHPIRALLFTHDLDLTGAPLCQLEMTEGLLTRGVLNPHVVSPVDGPLRERYEALGIEVTVMAGEGVDVGTDNGYGALQRTLADVIRASRPDVVYASTLQGFCAMDAARQAGRPGIWNIRESENPERYFAHLASRVRSTALSCFEFPYRVVFDSNACRNLFERWNVGRNFVVVHTGLARDDWARQLDRWPRSAARSNLGFEPSDVVFLLLGTVCERKGQLDLVEAMARGAAELPTVRSLIVGDRPSDYSDMVARAVAALPPGVRRRISVVPETPDVARYYSAADVFVCTSRIESFPRVTLEAMAAARPLITTKVFGIAEQLAYARHTLEYEPGDVSTLARHLDLLASDPERRRVMAAESIAVLDGLKNFDEMLQDYETVFREAAESVIPHVDPLVANVSASTRRT
jgi:GT2 family glycosyltransferase/glycosyltransferase involved in cell wall biosynthesis